MKEKGGNPIEVITGVSVFEKWLHGYLLDLDAKRGGGTEDDDIITKYTNQFHFDLGSQGADGQIINIALAVAKWGHRQNKHIKTEADAKNLFISWLKSTKDRKIEDDFDEKENTKEVNKYRIIEKILTKEVIDAFKQANWEAKQKLRDIHLDKILEAVKATNQHSVLKAIEYEPLRKWLVANNLNYAQPKKKYIFSEESLKIVKKGLKDGKTIPEICAENNMPYKSTISYIHDNISPEEIEAIQKEIRERNIKFIAETLGVEILSEMKANFKHKERIIFRPENSEKILKILTKVGVQYFATAFLGIDRNLFTYHCKDKLPDVWKKYQAFERDKIEKKASKN